jgi:hypothetical protein
MKRIFTDPSVVPCDVLKSMLESQGLMVVIKNERGSASAGVGFPVPAMLSIPFAWPEVWVSDEDYETAKTLIADMKKEESGDSFWVCSRCREKVNGELAVCWNCETPRNPDDPPPEPVADSARSG